ncbi:MAG: hypothetical protein E7476_13200 [Ruminococcaceae bacterium]|jgi:hypothetical protein|nr:hypothetical protein [Oscillospiraceae bacterium]
MKNTLTQRIVLAILALFLFVYVGFQVYRFLNSRYRTETALLYTVSESSRITGIALRDELILDDRIGNEVAVYMVEDGAKVSIHSQLAEVFRNKADAEATAKMRELEIKRGLLEKSQDPGTTSYAHTDVLNKQIFSEVGSIVDAVNTDTLINLQNTADKLLVLINTKQIATGQQNDFQNAIDQISAEEDFYAQKITEEPQIIQSPQPGYFIRAIDGFENKVDMKELDQLDASQLFQLMNQPAQKKSRPDGRVGKLMVDHNWYFAATVPDDEIAKYRLNGIVTLDFNISGLSPVTATICNVNKDPEKGNVVIFRCGYINESLVNLRIAQADVQFKSVTGLRISEQAIRFVGMQKGVYTLVGDKLLFRPVNVVYEDVGFVLCRDNDPEYANNPDFGRGLQQFDEVVIEGMNLYDSKQVG